jgi:hypothetical protein
LEGLHALNPEIAGILVDVPELAFISIRNGQLTYVPPQFHTDAHRAVPVISYLRAYAAVRRFQGDFFLCLYDGWREYSLPSAQPNFVPWNVVDKRRYLARGTRGEPRFIHRFDDCIFPEMPLPVLAFCRHVGDRNTWLIPDCEFLTDQFAGFTAQVSTGDVAWDAKDDSSLFWRGRRSPVRHLNETPPRDFVTSFGSSEVDAQYSTGEVPLSQFLQHKYLLDVDGMASAWSGLYWKLRSNSVPVKLRSHWEQWYYPMLLDGEHLVMTGRDLLSTYKSLIRNDSWAQEVAEKGKILSKSLTYRFALEEYVIGDCNDF